jgi:hypothetical protein
MAAAPSCRRNTHTRAQDFLIPDSAPWLPTMASRRFRQRKARRSWKRRFGEGSSDGGGPGHFVPCRSVRRPYGRAGGCDARAPAPHSTHSPGSCQPWQVVKKRSGPADRDKLHGLPPGGADSHGGGQHQPCVSATPNNARQCLQAAFPISWGMSLAAGTTNPQRTACAAPPIIRTAAKGLIHRRQVDHKFLRRGLFFVHQARRRGIWMVSSGRALP